MWCGYGKSGGRKRIRSKPRARPSPEERTSTRDSPGAGEESKVTERGGQGRRGGHSETQGRRQARARDPNATLCLTFNKTSARLGAYPIPRGPSAPAWEPVEPGGTPAQSPQVHVHHTVEALPLLRPVPFPHQSQALMFPNGIRHSTRVP